MKPLDFAKAIGAAVLVVIAEALVSWLVIVGILAAYEGPRSQDLSAVLLLQAAKITSRLAAATLTTLLCFWLGRGRAGHGPFIFAGIVWAALVVFEFIWFGSRMSMTTGFAFKLTLLLAAALLGAWLVKRLRRKVDVAGVF